MTNKRLMIRLIDVALIILLGFIAISRLKTEYVNLPSGSNSQVTTERPHEAFVRHLKLLLITNNSYHINTLRHPKAFANLGNSQTVLNGCIPI